MAVYDGFRKAKPQHDSAQRGWRKLLFLFIPEYNGGIFGGDVSFPQ
jgi:hypothetical protein